MKIIEIALVVIVVCVALKILLKVISILVNIVCIALLKIKIEKDEGDEWLIGKDVEKWADELKEALMLEVSIGEIKQNKEAFKLYKNIKRRKRNAKKAKKKIMHVGGKR